MNLICLVLLLVLAVYILDVNANSCLGANDVSSCKWNECCAKRKILTGFECKNKSDKVDTRCGGEYTCSCTNGLNCVPDSGSFIDTFKQGTGNCKRVGFIQG